MSTITNPISISSINLLFSVKFLFILSYPPYSYTVFSVSPTYISTLNPLRPILLYILKKVETVRPKDSQMYVDMAHVPFMVLGTIT